MCFKKIFPPKPELPAEQPYTGKTALLFARNDLPGSANDLKGCLNDQVNVYYWLRTYYPEFTIYVFKETLVIKKNFREWFMKFKNQLRPGDDLFVHNSGHGTRGFDRQGEEADGYSEGIYFADGVLWDYEFREMLTGIPDGARVTLALDICHSGGAVSRANDYFKNRFIETDRIPEGIKRKQAFLRDFDHKGILQFAACGEGQTAADAFINGEYCGAFTHFWLETFYEHQTCNGWIEATKRACHDIAMYKQIPELLLDEQMKQNPIFL